MKKPNLVFVLMVAMTPGLAFAQLSPPRLLGSGSADGSGSYLASDYTNATSAFSNTALSVPVQSGRKYRVTASLFLTESTAADGVKIDFAGGSAAATSFVATCDIVNALGTNLPQTNATTVALATTINLGATTDANVHIYKCSGGFEPSGDGTFIIRGAQNAHTTGTLTIKRGSWLSLVYTP